MDMKRAASIAGTAAVSGLLPYGFILGPIAAVAATLATSQDDIKEAEAKGVETLSEEAKKQKILMELQTHQARVAQEMSIAERIASSVEVEIEEFYDASGKGGLGIDVGKDNVFGGATGEGRKITKRIIRFKGGELKANEVLDAEENPSSQHD